MEKYINTMKELLEVDDLDLNDELSSFDAWDSLTNLSVLAFCSSEYGISLTADEIEEAKTLKGLKELIESRQ
ncbi:MAG: acyl carrier protein [Bacteroidota bacterium]